MKHVKLFESWATPTSIEDEVYELLKKINAKDKSIEYSFEPHEKGDSKKLRSYDEHNSDEKAVDIDLTIKYKNSKGEKREIDFVVKFAYTHYAATNKHSDPSSGRDEENVLEDLDFDSFFVSDDEGEAINCEFTPGIHVEAIKLLSGCTGVSDFSRSFNTEIKKLKAKI